MNTTIFPHHDSPEYLRARRKGLEALPYPVQRRVSVLELAIRASDDMPGSVLFTADTIKFTPSPDISAESDKESAQNLNTSNQDKPSESKTLLETAYQSINDAFRNN